MDMPTPGSQKEGKAREESEKQTEEPAEIRKKNQLCTELLLSVDTSTGERWGPGGCSVRKA